MKRSVLIIGGGFTGLTAAHRLSQSGVDVCVVEKSPALGGLAGGFRLHGFPLEKTYHHLFRSDTDILRLVDELKLGSRLQWHESSMAVFHGGKSHPFTTAKDVLRFRPLSLASRVRLGAVIFFLQRWRNWRRLEHKTATAWMLRACGAEAMRVIWTPLLRGKFSSFADRVSMAWLWARIHVRANSRDSANAPEKLGYFDGGFEVVSERLAQLITGARGSILTSCEISRLEQRGTQWQATFNGTTRIFDKIVFTGSSRAFARLLEASQLGPPEYLDRLRSVPYLGAACLVFAYPDELGEAYWTNINESDAPFLVFINHTRLVPCSRYGGRRIYYIGVYLKQDDPLFTGPASDIKTHWFSYLAQIIPTFSPAKITESHLFRLGDAQHVVDPNYRQHMPDVQTHHPGLLLSNFSQIFPEDRGTNYAVREGEKLARQILESAS